MFTGIITDIGVVQDMRQGGDLWARIGTNYDTSTIEIGASIAHDGICLTVIALHKAAYEVKISAETIACSTIATGRKPWQLTKRLNLERALKIGDELGGHIVSGHVDGVAQIIDLKQQGDSLRVKLRAPADLAQFIAPKGSVTLDGISLTVNTVENCDFDINLIAHTQTATTWNDLQIGDCVNLEIDTLARYVARLRDFTAQDIPR